MAGRKRKCPAAPEKITHYFVLVKDSDDGSVEMEFEEPTSPAGQSRTNSDCDDGTDSATISQSQAQSDYESSGGNIMDLGSIIKPFMTTLKDVCDAIDKLDNEQKYKPLTEHFKPTFSSGCNRSFQYRWLEKYAWLVYSKQLDGEFCKFL